MKCLFQGQWLWYSWQSSRFQLQKTRVQIQSLAIFKNFMYCKLKVGRGCSQPTNDLGFNFCLSSTGHQQQLATYTEAERDSWVSALQAASHGRMRQHLDTLQKKLRSKLLSLGLTSEAEAIDLADGEAGEGLKNSLSVIGKSNLNYF